MALLLASLFPSLVSPMPWPCAPVVAGQMYACSTGHAYTTDGVDLGPLHAVRVRVPALLER